MYTELTMIIRYGLMALVGYYVSQGYISGTLTEPLIGFGLAIFTYIWKKVEAYNQAKKVEAKITSIKSDLKETKAELKETVIELKEEKKK